MTATIVQILGMILTIVGLWMVWPPLGVVVAGLSVLMFGLALERRG